MKRQLCLGLILVIWALLIHPLPVWAANVPTPSEQSVLEVIARYPEAIVESLNAYQQQQDQARAAAQAKALDAVHQDFPAFVSDSPIRGDRTNKISLVEFADFQCPFCIQAHQPIQSLLARHPDVAFVFKHLPVVELHDQALPAAMAAWAAEQQGQFWTFYDALFGTDEPLTGDRYVQVAQSLDLDLERWDRDRHSTQAGEAIAADIAQASELGVTGTPFFLVVGSSHVTPIIGANIGAIEAQLSLDTSQE